jgi:hypothetical protein
MIRLVAWGRYRSPAVVRQHYFRVGRATGLFYSLTKSVISQFRTNVGAGTVLRDAVHSWNQDWKQRREIR